MTKRQPPEHGTTCECCKNGMEGFMKSLEKMISKVGHAVVQTKHILPNNDMINMSYTVGLSDDGLPEIVVFSLPPETARSLINDAVELLKAGTLKTSTPTTQVANFPLYFQAVPAARARGYINVANDRARVPQEAIQMIWPDPKGKFPWDDGFDPDYRDSQPLLFHSRFLPLARPTPETHGDEALSLAQRARRAAAENVTGTAIEKAKKTSTSEPR